MPGTIYISGLYSGIDWSQMIDQIMQIEHKQVDILEDQKQVYENRLSAWQELNTKLLNVKTQAEDLSSVDAFNVFSANLVASSGSAEDFVIATTNTDATVGVYQFTIKQLAYAKVDRSKSFTSSSDALNLSGTLEIKATGAADWTDITIDTTDSLTTIKNKINEHTEETGIIASIVQYAEDDYRLILTAQETGTANAFEVGQTDIAKTTNGLGFWDDAGTTENTVQSAQNAIINIYGEDAERGSNTITDLIPGVTLDLLKADENITITLTVERDIGQIVDNIQDLFNRLNEVFTYINEQSSYSGTEESAPPLIGDSNLLFLRNDLKNRISEGVSWDSTTHYLFEIGITTDEDGLYTIDEDELRESLTNNFETVRNLFVETENSTGVAAKLNEFLDFITDEYADGYVQGRMDELEENIDNIDDRIEEMETRLERKREQLYQQFNALETYIAQMQQMQQWLTQQLGYLSK